MLMIAHRDSQYGKLKDDGRESLSLRNILDNLNNSRDCM